MTCEHAGALDGVLSFAGMALTLAGMDPGVLAGMDPPHAI